MSNEDLKPEVLKQVRDHIDSSIIGRVPHIVDMDAGLCAEVMESLEIPATDDRWKPQSATQIIQNMIEAYKKAFNVQAQPQQMPNVQAPPRSDNLVPRGWFDEFINAPRKKKKHYNVHGIFVSARSRKGRRQARDCAREMRKLAKISMRFRASVISKLSAGAETRKLGKMFTLS